MRDVNPSSACAYDRLVADRALFSYFKLWESRTGSRTRKSQTIGRSG